MIITHLAGKFLNILYGPLAFLYDTVAWLVSFGQWKKWTFSILPLLQGEKFLELGSGPGHLQTQLINQNFETYGIDSSRQMTKLSLKRLKKGLANSFLQDNQSIIRGLAGQLPFPSQFFDTVIATFPTTYIFEQSVLHEIRRVLKTEGKLIVLLSSHPRADNLPSLLLRILYRVTGETPASSLQMEKYACKILINSGFNVSIHRIASKYSDLYFLMT